MEQKSLKSNLVAIKKDYDLFLKKLTSDLPLTNYFLHLPNSLKEIFFKKYTDGTPFNFEKFKSFEKLVNIIDKSFFAFLNLYLIIPSYITTKILDSYSLQKDYFPKDIKKVKVPPELKVDYTLTIDEDKIKDNSYQVIFKFLEIMQNNFPEESLKLFYKNITTLNVKSTDNMKDYSPTSTVLGKYDIKKNIITLLEGTEECTMIHELFHMASNYYDKKTGTNFSGFHQTTSSFSMGIGIDEGYTQLLTNRYSEKSYCYIYETFIAKKIEQLIGENKMQSLYFSGNLLGLIDELSRYERKDKVIQFIQQLDICTKYNKSNKSIPKKNEILEESFEKIEEFLIKIELKKIKDDLELMKTTDNKQNYVLLKLAILFSDLKDNFERRISFEKIKNYIKEILNLDIPINSITVGAFQLLAAKQTQNDHYCEEKYFLKRLTDYNIDEQMMLEILNGNFSLLNNYLASFMEEEKIKNFYNAVNESAKLKYSETQMPNEYNKTIEEFLLECELKRQKEDFLKSLSFIINNPNLEDFSILELTLKNIFLSYKCIPIDEFKSKVKEILNIEININEDGKVEITNVLNDGLKGSGR